MLATSLPALGLRTLARPAASTFLTFNPKVNPCATLVLGSARLLTTPSSPAPTAPTTTVTVTVFKVPECMLCEEAKHICDVVAKKAASTDPQVTVNVASVDIHDPKTKGQFLKYMMNVPVIHLNDRLWGMHRVDPGKLLSDVQRAATASSSAHAQQEESPNPNPPQSSPVVSPEAEAKQTN